MVSGQPLYEIRTVIKIILKMNTTNDIKKTTTNNNKTIINSFIIFTVK